MEIWLSVLCLVLLVLSAVLGIKICGIRKAAEEIREQFAHCCQEDTNGRIAISSRDSRMCRLAADLNRQLAIFHQKRRRFQQGDQELKEAVTNISHDLRTPLTAIYGYLDLLEQEEKSETVNRYIAVIRNRTKMLKQLMQFKYSGKSIPSSGVGILLSYKS